MSLSLDEMVGRLLGLPPEQQAEALETIAKETAAFKWVPNPGPQSDAYFSPAKVLLYGGQGGGGKTELGLGLAFTAHQRSLIMRRRYANLSGMTERAVKINGTRTGFNGSPPPLLRTIDGRYIQFGANQHLGDEQAWQGQAFDLKYFDEATQFLEQQIRFHLGWLRDAEDPKQRTRAVLGSNPPISSDGDWIVGMFRPWLDLTHPVPAKAGELRWYVRTPDDIDLEVPESDLLYDEFKRPFIELAGAKAMAHSRSFIPASVRDNPFLIKTDYIAQLDALPEPIRSAVRDGNFMAARADANYQVIPTSWLLEAEKRWSPDGWKQYAMTAMGFDPAGGGKDSAVLAWRHYGWFAPLVADKGELTAESTAGATAIFQNRRDGAPVVIDVGGGYAGAVKVRLQDNNIPIYPFNGANTSTGKALATKLPFANKRAEAWWRFREALDPNQDGGSIVALPPDTMLRADLLAPCLNAKVLEQGKIQIESKEDLRKRLGRSPDRGDAVVMCMHDGGKAVARATMGGGHNRPLAAQTTNPNRGRYSRYSRSGSGRSNRSSGPADGGEQS